MYRHGLYINGELIEEEFLEKNDLYDTCYSDRSNLCSDGITLGEDEYFVMGDNRKFSMDSRHMEKVVTKDMIFAKGVLLFGECKDTSSGVCKDFKFDKIRIVK